MGRDKRGRRAIQWVILILLGGCCLAGVEPKSKRETEVRELDHDFKLVYSAVLHVLSARGYEISLEDPEAGLIETRWLEGKYNRTKARVEVKPLGRGRTLVSLGIRLEQKGLTGGEWKPAKVRMSVYEQLFDEIDLQTYREYFYKIERR